MATLKDQMQMFCRHFTGVQNEICEKDISYADVRERPPEGGMYRFPCTNPDYRHNCALWEPYTIEEIEQRDREYTDAMTSLITFMEHDTDICPHCGKQVTRLQQVGHCVYGDPCGCRLWQGSIPDEWRGTE